MRKGMIMINRVMALLCVSVIILNLTACDKSDDPVASDNATSESVSGQTESTVKEWDIGGYQAWDYEGNISYVSMKVRKSESVYYLETSDSAGVLSNVALSSPYSDLNGIVLNERKMEKNFAVYESDSAGYYIVFMTGNDEVSFFTVYYGDDTGVYPIRLQGGEDNVFECKPGDELSCFGQYVYIGDKLVMMEYLDTYIPVPEIEKGMTWIGTLNTGDNLYLEKGTTVSDDMISYPFAVMRYSTGKYADSITEPELFQQVDEGMFAGGYEYIGDAVTTKDAFPYTKVTAGQKLPCGYTVDEAVLDLRYYQNDDGTYSSYTVSNYIHISEDVTLTGTLRYFGEDNYYYGNGDMMFIPDGSYSGLPVPVSESYFEGGFTNMYDIGDAAEGPLVIYSDAVPFSVGNYFLDYSDNADMKSIWNDLTEDGRSWSCAVKITLSDVSVSCSEENGFSGTAAIAAVEGVS